MCNPWDLGHSCCVPVAGAASAAGQTGYVTAERVEGAMDRRASAVVMNNVMKKPDLSDPKLRAKV